MTLGNRCINQVEVPLLRRGLSACNLVAIVYFFIQFLEHNYHLFYLAVISALLLISSALNFSVAKAIDFLALFILSIFLLVSGIFLGQVLTSPYFWATTSGVNAFLITVSQIIWAAISWWYIRGKNSKASQLI